jgi:hypothetical protein
VARLLWLALALALAFAALPVPAWSQPADEDSPPEIPPDQRTARDVDGAPPPGAESGRVDATRARDPALRELARGALFVPRLVLEAAFVPVRGGLWAYDRFDLKERYLDLFFDDTRTYGLVPTARLRSGYGVTWGARFVHRDLFGEREHLSLRAATGGRYQQLTSARLRSGERFGRLQVELDGEIERRPKDAYYGIGNAGDSAEARYRLQVGRVIATSDVRVWGPLHVRASGAIFDFDYGRSDQGPPIDELYSPIALTGFEGVRQAYGELELRWDSRRRGSPWESPSVFATGGLLAGFVGRAVAFDGEHEFWRYGIDAQRYVRLGPGPRVLALRVFGEAVTGSYMDVPFSQLPVLGGSQLLRGYPVDRFRDRVAVLTSAEYRWDLSRALTASAFVDVGRVYPSLAEIPSTIEGIRVGYGLALDAHTDKSFVVRTTLATTIDGGMFVDLSFNPVFDLEPRVERE